jgi:[calcium/calmodulin-dependent protein kinase] kinase
MRPSIMRKSKSQDTHDRRPVEGVLSTEGVHHEIKIDEKGRKLPHNMNDMAYFKSGFRAEASGKRSAAKAPVASSPTAPTPPGPKDARVMHENMSIRPMPPHSAASPAGIIPTSGPTTPIGKGHAHNPLEDTLFLNIGTGEDYLPEPEDGCVVSESPSNVDDMNVYETAYEEEVQRIIAQRKEQHNASANASASANTSVSASASTSRRPTLYLTRRVENIKSIRDSDAIFDEGQDLRQNIKVSLKSFVTRTKEDIEARGELQKIQDGKEGKLSRTMRNVREAKRLVEEARERVKTEERDRERERSRSATPVLRTNSSGSMLSRSGTPVAM